MQRKRRNLTPKIEMPSPLKDYLLSTPFSQQFVLNSHQELWSPSLMLQPMINGSTGFMRPMSCMSEH